MSMIAMLGSRGTKVGKTKPGTEDKGRPRQWKKGKYKNYLIDINPANSSLLEVLIQYSHSVL